MSCQSVKEGLSGKKKTNSDEFLVEKKNPLVLPPDFTKLPEPTTSENNKKENKNEDELKKIIIKAESSNEITSKHNVSLISDEIA